MIEVINNLASAWAEYISMDIAQDTIFLAIIFMLLYFYKNIDARLRYVVAAVGLFKLLLPPFIPAPFFSGIGFMAKNSTRVTSADISVLPAHEISYSEPLSLVGLLFLIWAFTAAISLIVPLVSTFRLHLKLKDAIEISPETLDPNLKTYFYKICKTDKINMPLTIGVFSKRIYVPAQWDKWSNACRKMIIDHELAHIKRKDGLVQIFQILAQAVYFFHPLVWILNTRINQYREMACDDATVSWKSSSQVEYSRYLVEIAEEITLSELGCSSASALIRQKNELLNRVQYQIKEGSKMKITNKKMGLIVAALFLLIIPFSWTVGEEATIGAAEAPNFEAVKTGKIYGTVYNQKTGEPLSGVVIDVKGMEIQVKTNANGNYFIANMAPGEYSLKAELMGYKTIIIKDVSVKEGKSTEIDFKLESVLIRKQAGETTPPPPPPPPPKVEDEEIKFVPFDVPPKPIGGFEAIQEKLTYPEIARKAGIEGTVIINVKISEKGDVVAAKVVKSLGNNGCAESAIEAIKAVKWEPAIQRDKPVEVWVAVPVKFALSDGKEKMMSEDEKLINKVDFDQAPQPVGGFKAIQEKLTYPDEARKTGTMGEVLVNVFINEQGKLTKIKIKKSLNPECDKAAIVALKSVEWKPAEKDGKPIETWVTIPVNFKLK